MHHAHPISHSIIQPSFCYNNALQLQTIFASAWQAARRTEAVVSLSPLYHELFKWQMNGVEITRTVLQELPLHLI